MAPLMWSQALPSMPATMIMSQCTMEKVKRAEKLVHSVAIPAGPFRPSTAQEDTCTLSSSPTAITLNMLDSNCSIQLIEKVMGEKNKMCT